MDNILLKRLYSTAYKLLFHFNTETRTQFSLILNTLVKEVCNYSSKSKLTQYSETITRRIEEKDVQTFINFSLQNVFGIRYFKKLGIVYDETSINRFVTIILVVLKQHSSLMESSTLNF